MLNRLIIFLIRRKLGVKKFERFKFTNQKTKDAYFFNDNNLIKIVDGEGVHGFDLFFTPFEKSGVSLNWLLSEECEIECL